MSYLFELNDAFLEKFDNHKYWTHDSQFTIMAQYCDYVIECRTDGSFFYIKNRYDGSTEVLPRDGSYKWITAQILKSKQYVGPSRKPGVAAFYAPYVPLTVVDIT